MPNETLSIEQTMTIIRETPERLSALTTGLSNVQLRTSTGQGEWSANDVLAHLRACADVWGNCILTIISQDSPTLRAINPRSWIKETNYLAQEFQPSLRAYTWQRKGLVQALQALPRRAWSRSATVTGAGKPLERDVLYYARWLAGHERPHVRQIKSIVETLDQ